MFPNNAATKSGKGSKPRERESFGLAFNFEVHYAISPLLRFVAIAILILSVYRAFQLQLRDFIISVSTLNVEERSNTSAIDTFVIPTMTQTRKAFEQLVKYLFWSLPGQLQQQLDDWPIETFVAALRLDRSL